MRLWARVKLAPGAQAPQYKSDGAAGADLYAYLPGGSVPLFGGESRVIPTGVHLELPPGYEAQVRPRSGLARAGVTAVLGTVDSDYRGEIGVLLTVARGASVTIHHGDRIAQLVVSPVARVSFQAVEELGETARGEKGWGSTGKGDGDAP